MKLKNIPKIFFLGSVSSTRAGLLAAAVTLACTPCVQSAYRMVSGPTHLTLSEGFEDPLGFYDATPSFSWQLPQDGTVQRQSVYRIVVATDPKLLPDKADLWDSGQVKTDQSVWVPYQGKALKSRQRGYWQVQFWDEKNRASAWSKPAHFELGLLGNSDWKGQWIQMKGAKGFEPPALWAVDDTATHRKNADIKIVDAQYGILTDPSKTIDVTVTISDMVSNDDYLLEVSDALARGASVPDGNVKLFIDYSVNGKNVRKTLEKGSTFDLFARRDYVTLVPEYLRKQFNLGAPITKARLYVSARGLYEVYLNGSRVGQDYMAPGWTTYRSWIETLTYDVMEQLQEGENAIGAIIGEGWYAGRIGCSGSYTDSHPDLLCQLEVTLASGEKVIIVTDDSWKATNKGPIRLSSIFDGEVYDARLEMAGWDRVGFDDSKWAKVLTKKIDPKVALVPKEHHPVRITQELPTLKVTEPHPGKFIFDFGQNIVGWPKLTIPVRAGETMKVRFAEMLKQDGTLYTENYRTARSTDYYTAAKNGTITWHPVFTFHGFRYVELSGFPAETNPDAGWVTGAVLHSDFEQTGKFSSSHAKLNKLHENIIWGQRGNFLDIPTDCPQRDERQGWTGDAQVFCPTSLFNYNVHSFWMSWLHSMRANQCSNGIIPWIVPSAGEFKKFGSPGWGDAAVTVPWEVYVRTGNRSILEENYDMMQRWVAAYEPDAKDFIVTRDGFGDWLQPYSQGNLQEKRGALVGETSLELIATAYFGRCSAIMQQAATILGRTEDAVRYEKQVANIRSVFSKKFFDPNGKLTTAFDTQTGYLMALGYDLLEPELQAGAIKNLLRLIEEAGGHLRTGFLGTPLLAFVLDQCGHPDVAYEALFKETYPSWFYSINQGATTMWERWNSFSHEDGFGDAKMNSFNHYAYGAIGQWMYERIAGLASDPAHPGYKHFFIQPIPGGPLTSAEAELETPYGRAVSGWRQSGETLIINATIPPNTRATLVVPSRKGTTPKVIESGKLCKLIPKEGRFVYELKPGTYVFSIQ